MSNRAIALHSREQIAALLRQDIALHLYAIGDLDDFFWPSTQWYALDADGAARAPILCYDVGDLLVLHALGDVAALSELIGHIAHLLPRRIYTHLSPGVEPAFATHYALEDHGAYAKMLLADRSAIAMVDTSAAEVLTVADTVEALAFYADAYPHGWFDARMLQTGQYVGMRHGGRLASVAGVHVYSPSQRVAAIGNVATLPALRGRGLATVAVAALCALLGETVDVIGLNVRCDNASAIGCYERLGFTTVGEYGEWMLTQKEP